jgi:hypothetical protein
VSIKHPKNNRKKIALKTQVFLVAFAMLIVGVFQTNAHASTVLWMEYFVDNDGDYSVSYYADIDSITFGITDTDPDSIIALIEPYYSTSLTMFTGGGSGGLFFDTNQDSVRDIWAYAPNSTLSAFSQARREIYRGVSPNLIATGCYSSWSLHSDYTSYDVIIPWRCLGAPSTLGIEGWLSNSTGFDFLTGSRTVFPVSLPATTTTVYVPPPTTVYVAPPPVTAPLTAAANVSVPGMIDDWVDYLIVKKSVSISAVLNSTDCCYGVKSGTRIMTVVPKSKKFCAVRGRRLYALKVGSCTVKITTGSGKKIKKETIKFAVKRN